MTDDIPIMATVLSAHEVAASGGDTEFASTYAAYEALSDEEKEQALDTRVVHSFLAAQKLSHPNASPEADIEFWSKRPPKTHPLVWRHENGRKSLVLGATTDHVEGMSEDEGRAYLADLLDRSTVPERVYRHEWAVGDLVIWDNRGVLHRATRVRPVVGTRHAPHHHRRQRGGAVTTAASNGPAHPAAAARRVGRRRARRHRRAASRRAPRRSCGARRADRRVSTCSARSRSTPR